VGISISEVVEELIILNQEFADNTQLTDAILEHKEAESFLIAVGMAVAHKEGAITMDTKGERHLRTALAALRQIFDSIEERDE
jgi:hypothetical protein